MWLPNLVGGSITLLFGLFVRIFKTAGLIAGYNTLPAKEKAKYNVKKLSKYVGNLLIFSSLILLLGALLAYITNIDLIVVSISWALYIIVIIVSVISMNIGDKFKNT
ncbi:DUF3784 domain-containing protein [Lachnospiraceae bacterium MD1]|jgi:hypothetical protein|uniref:DUF3784 domain-containing protein n=1 Tax=Variimorphobacter saccharofermentans TaxID=2755051 RepID=A0A839K2Q8_9FIRM|nr:DUF3784 domain-containing protein [Variimorphobacter saccharofermentans]MBB2184114.1 DUF3784 domain-containing protein [Variimorphobacter saccharofermentans]